MLFSRVILTLYFGVLFWRDILIFYAGVLQSTLVIVPLSHVPEVLNVHMSKIYKKITTIKLNKLKFKKVLKKNRISFLKS